MRLPAYLIVLVLLAAPAAAQPQEAPVPELPLGAPEAPAGDSLLDQIGDAGQAVGDAFQSAGRSIADLAGAVAGAVADAFRWSVDAAADAATGVTAAAGAVAAFLAAGGAAIGRTLHAAAGSIGAGFSAVVVATAAGAWQGLVTLAHAVGALVAAYVGALEPLRPQRMSPGLFHAAAGAGAAASATAAGHGAWPTLRRWMSGLLGLAGFSRIGEDRLLEHPLRNRIFAVIQQNPGIHPSALAREAGTGWGTIVHHLQKLEKARLVASRRVNNQKCFFEQGGVVSRQDMAVASAIKGGTAAGIAGFVRHHPMASQKDVAEALGISPALASFHVKKLVAQGALDRVRRGKAWLLMTSDSFRRVAGDSGTAVLTGPPASARAVA